MRKPVNIAEWSAEDKAALKAELIRTGNIARQAYAQVAKMAPLLDEKRPEVRRKNREKIRRTLESFPPDLREAVRTRLNAAIQAKKNGKVGL